jgi:prepilin signal peptidase PulO-like enzyme (type II secretory pathway)
VVNWSVPLAALLGLAIGGVVNWLADYLPYTARLGLPRYPDGTARPRTAWLGVSAFLFAQRSAPSGSALSWRHPLTEISVAALFAYIAAQSAGDGLRALFLMGNVTILVLITIIDLEHRMILYLVIVPSCLYASAWRGAARRAPCAEFALRRLLDRRRRWLRLIFFDVLRRHSVQLHHVECARRADR